MNDDEEMNVIKRNGNTEIVSFDKILNRIKTLGNMKSEKLSINYTTLTIKIIDQLYNKITTTKIDELSAQQCASLATVHTDYNILAGRIVISNHHKNTSESFIELTEKLHNYNKRGTKMALVSDQYYDNVQLLNKENKVNNICDFSRDYDIDYFGFKTLENAYLIKIDGVIVERPQHLWLRVAIGIHGSNLEKVKESYYYMSCKYFTQATPTLFNAGTPKPQLASCFLIAMEDDSISGIYNTLKECAIISQHSGGIGLHIHNIRAKGSYINGTNGYSNGIVPMLRVFNNTAKYVDQCVVPTTIVYTDTGPMEIQYCVANVTKVFGENGKLETIGKVLEHEYTGKLLNISVCNSTADNCGLLITDEHPIYSVSYLDFDQYLTNNSDTTSNNSDTTSNNSDTTYNNSDTTTFHQYIIGKDLMAGDMIVYPRPHRIITNMVGPSLDDCIMYGILWNQKHIENNSTEFINKAYCDVSNTLIYEFIVKYLQNKCIQYNIDKIKNVIQFSWTVNIEMPFRVSDFIMPNKQYGIHNRWLQLSDLHLAGILSGMLLASLKCEFYGSHINNPSMHYLCLCLGTILYINEYCGPISVAYTNELSILIKTIITENISDTLNNCNKLYNNKDPINMDTMYIFMLFDKYTFYSTNKYVYSRITQIDDSTYYTGILYDLQMNIEHNYLLLNGLVHNGGGKRNGSFAIYIEPWHADIESFLDLRKNHGIEELRARDLFYALWIPDLFMARVKSNEKWTLMCPNECPGLSDLYGDAFVTKYEEYERNNMGRQSISARELWYKILDAQMETGIPYILYKDAANKKSNQKNIGTIKSSNLCTEIIQYSDDNETAVCNLGSIALPMFIINKSGKNEFDFELLHKVTMILTENLNKIIDINYYAGPKMATSNNKHRPIGMGIQGLADLFILMDYAFTSDSAKKLNIDIFETMYHAALTKSCELAKNYGPYDTFYPYSSTDKNNNVINHSGCPASDGILQFDLWNITPSSKYNWTELKNNIKLYGLRNSLLIAPMPTASTSQILGYNECFEPFTSNIYSRRTLAGDFMMVNKYLMKELIDANIWSIDIKNSIISNNGSIQHLIQLSPHIRDKYKTVWELNMNDIIDMSADRGPYICQSQSLNLWVDDPSYAILTKMHFYSWSKGLKTGMYYLRRRPVYSAQQFTIEPTNNAVCETCSS